MNYPISVILPVYNVPQDWLIQSIESILHQTISNFELLVINDSPTNQDLKHTLHHFEQKDTRIKLIENTRNLGISKSLNKAIQIAKGKYIARMDADDIAFPKRLEHQFNYLEQNPEVALCGTQAIKIDQHGKPFGKTQNPIDHNLIIKVAPYQNPTTHPTWMIRRAEILKVGLYRNFPNAEDYDLIIRLIRQGTKITNLSETLLQYRVHTNSQSFGKSLEQKICIQYIQMNLLKSPEAFDPKKLTQYLEEIKGRHKNQKSYLYQARVSGNPFSKLLFSTLAFLDSSIERRYLRNLSTAKIIKFIYP